MPRLQQHDRFDYLPMPGRAHYLWPGGTRFAVHVAINLEAFAFGEGLGAELTPGGPQPGVLNYCWREYCNRVGAWRLIDLLDALKLPASVLINSEIYTEAQRLPTPFAREATNSSVMAAQILSGRERLARPTRRRLSCKRPA